MKKRIWMISFSLLVSVNVTNLVAADNDMSIEDRVNHLERLVNNKGLVDIMVRVESIQSELQRLLGEIELQKHTLEEIKKRQRDLYLDIDRRLLQVERRSGSNSTSGVTPSTSVSTTAMPEKSDELEHVDERVKNEPSVAENNKEGEQIAYQKAFDLLRALRYEKATDAFRQFLTDYPNGRYAHIAQYWLAETSYHTKKYAVAVSDYQTLIDQYPNSPKRADALLKIGYSQYELKQFSKSQSVLEKLIQSYPGTTEAGQAENLLQKIRLQKAQ